MQNRSMRSDDPFYIQEVLGAFDQTNYMLAL